MLTCRHALATLAIASATAAAIPAASEAATAKPDVTVMSRNLYLGADIIKLASATSLEDEIDQLQADEKIDAELQAMKAALKAKRPQLAN